MSECLICYQLSSRFETLHDNHRVCVDCYKRLQAPTCPFCRASIKLYQKPDLFNKYRKNEYYINTQRVERRYLFLKQPSTTQTLRTAQAEITQPLAFTNSAEYIPPAIGSKD